MTYRIGIFTLASCVFAMAWTAPAVAEPVKDKSVYDATGPWQLFIDDYLIASKTNVARRYHPFRKYKKDYPLIVVDKPWEAHVVNACTVLPGEDGTGFRMWYYCWTERKDGKRRGSYMCYATSEDGYKWVKPNLGLYEWDGGDPGTETKENNIIPNSASHVMPTPWETDPNKKYHGVGGMYYARVSPDGLNWTNLSDEKIISGGDTSHFYWDQHTKRFRCNVKGGGGARVDARVRTMRRRTVGFSETNDLTKFPPLRLIMAPDDVDDLWCKPDTVQRTHFYACPVLPYETMYIGLLQIYRAEEPVGYFHGPLWLELVSSRDGVHWLRAEADTAVRNIYSLQETSRPRLLDIGKFRQFDRGMVIAPTPLVVGDELWTYYTGYDEEHDLLPYKSAIGLAKMRKDGFVSLDADEATGEVLTKQFSDVGGKLQVNYNARGGSVRVEVLDADGNVIPGYSADECNPLTGNAVRGAVTWQSKRELPTGRGPVRFRFILERARLYSFTPGENAKVIDEKFAPPLQVLFTFDGKTNGYADMLPEDGVQTIHNLGTCRIDHKHPTPAFGERSLEIGEGFRPWNRAEIRGTQNLGTHFTLAAMVKIKKNVQLARLFSAYRGNYPVNTSELVFDFDPRGKVINGMRLICKGITVQSDKLKFADHEYHHLAVTYDDGEVTFYLDGKQAGREWIPGGDPVKLERNLLIGEDAEMGSDEQLHGNADDILILGRVLGAQDIATLSEKGATVFFGLEEVDKEE